MDRLFAPTILAQLIFGLMISSQVASADDGQNGSSCPALSVDSRYADLKATANEKDLSVGVTMLLSEALDSHLKALHDHIVAIPKAKIEEIVQKMDMETFPWRVGESHIIGESFDGIHSCQVFAGNYIGAINKVSWTAFNKTAMRRLVHSVCVIDYLIHSSNSYYFTLADKSRDLLKEKTYAGAKLIPHLVIGLLTVLQSAAQLTSDPVLDYSDDQMLRMSMQQRGLKPSLMVVHSLILPPAVLGRMGNYTYIPNSIMSDSNGGLKFTPDYREFLKQQRREYVTRDHEHYEIGHGCPIGHCLAGEDRPGLQYFLDAILYVYDRIGDE